MNDPSAQPVDILDQKNWLIDLRTKSNLSWAELAKRTGIPQGTLSQFGSERGYGGDEQTIADKVFRYRQMIAQQASIEVEAPQAPGYFETETSRSLCQLLTWAQRGKIVVAALGAGLGKSTTADHFSACFANVFKATMRPSTAGVNNMQIELLRIMGEKNAVGTPQKLSQRIVEMVENREHPVIIIDEAQHLSEKALEEIRSWHDSVKVGIALLGNIGVMQRLEGGARSSAFAQLFSRISLRMIRQLPLIGDIDALADAWRIHDEPTTAYLRKVCMTPGGLRNGTHALELASMIAASQQKPLAIDHLQDAWAQLSSRGGAA